MILANGFEDTEALATHDILKRSSLDVDMVSINETKEVVSQYHLHLKLEKTLKEAKLASMILVIQGGAVKFYGEP